MPQPTEMYIFIIAGLLNGLVTGLTGGNGMAVLMSILLLAGFKVHNIIGLCLVVQVFIMSATYFIFSTQVKPPLTLIPVLIIPALFAAFLGAKLALVTPDSLLTGFVIAVLLLASFLMLRSARRSQKRQPAELMPKNSPKRLPIVAITGALSGLAAGLVGGGANIIVANILAGKRIVTFQQAVALSLSLGVLAASVGSVPYVLAGRVAFQVLPILLVPAFLSALVAARFSTRIATAKVRQIQGVYLLVVVMVISVRGFLS